MELTRAIEILDPEHVEHYTEREGGLEEVNEACRMGMEALKEKLAAEESLSGAQWEMRLYEGAVEVYGKKNQVEDAARKLAKLVKELLNFAHSKEPDGLKETVNNARADAEIALNTLAVIFGDCSELEYQKLLEMGKWLDEQEKPKEGNYDCGCPEYEKRPCDNPNEGDLTCGECQHGVKRDGE